MDSKLMRVVLEARELFEGSEPRRWVIRGFVVISVAVVALTGLGLGLWRVLAGVAALLIAPIGLTLLYILLVEIKDDLEFHWRRPIRSVFGSSGFALLRPSPGAGRPLSMDRFMKQTLTYERHRVEAEHRRERSSSRLARVIGTSGFSVLRAQLPDKETRGHSREH